MKRNPIVHTDPATRPHIDREVRACNTAVGCGALVLAFLGLWLFIYAVVLVLGRLA